MSKIKNKLSKIEPSLDIVKKGSTSSSKHKALNNLNMVMFYMRKKDLSEDYFEAIEELSQELLEELKAL